MKKIKFNLIFNITHNQTPYKLNPAYRFYIQLKMILFGVDLLILYIILSTFTLSRIYIISYIHFRFFFLLFCNGLPTFELISNKTVKSGVSIAESQSAFLLFLSNHTDVSMSRACHVEG